MRLSRCSLAVLTFSIAIGLSSDVSLFAQNADPFGGAAPTNQVADPFAAGGASADPFASPNRPAMTRTRSAANSARVIADPPQAVARIRAALGEETTQTFIQTPLNEALVQLSRMHDIPILIDVRALEEIGLSADQPVTLDLKQVSLRSFLRLMCRPLDLTYMVSNEVLQITTVEAAEQSLTTEAYPFPKMLADKSDQVMEALASTVRPDSWEEQGGPCRVKAVGHVLVISGTEVVHESVREFFEKLQLAYEKHLAKQ